jgi:hypothetical protein
MVFVPETCCNFRSEVCDQSGDTPFFNTPESLFDVNGGGKLGGLKPSHAQLV